MKEKKISVKVFILLGVAINILLLILINFSPNHPVFDEVHFFNNYKLLLDSGLTIDYLKSYQYQAPGPIYQIFYYALNNLGFTISIYTTRYFSFAFFSVSLILLLKLINKIKSTNFWVLYFSVFSIPFLYPIICLGLTESISIFFLSVAINFFVKFLKKQSILYLIGFVIFYAITLVARQNFLIIFPVFLFFILGLNQVFYAKIKYTILMLFSLIPIAMLFFIWEGLVPPHQKIVAGNSLFDFSMGNGLLGLGYYAILVLLINPGFFLTKFSKNMLWTSVILGILAQYFLQIKFLPFSTFFNLFGSKPINLLFYIAPTFIFIIGIYLPFKLANIIKENYANKFTLFINVLNLALAFISFKIMHLFSARYVAQNSLLVLLLKNDLKFMRLKICLLIIGSAAGIISLYGYFLK